MIDEIVSPTNPTSKVVHGPALAQEGSKAQSTQITVQIVPAANDEEFEVELQGRIMPQGGAPPPFQRLGDDPFDHRSKSHFCIFPISMHCQYRFEHISGAAVRVLLSG